MTPACLLLATLSVAVSFAGDIKGKVTAQGIKSAENIAVYVAAIPGKTFPPASEHAAMDQRKLTFIPHVLVVLKGTQRWIFSTVTRWAITSTGRPSTTIKNWRITWEPGRRA